jgi:thiosulfate/3-mercaptopyruvate sulfurtransferase
MAPSRSPLISPEALAADLGSYRVIDMRWSLADPAAGRNGYEQAHIPGAVFVDMDAEITGPRRSEAETGSGKGGRGRHPLPTRVQFETAMRRAGVNNSDGVVVYDNGGGSAAGRLWWLLKAHGHDDVRLLDGGLQAWTGKLESGNVVVDEGDFVAKDIDMSMLAPIDDIPAVPVLIDARAPERYRGEVEPVDPIPGHIPGAKNAFWQGNLGPKGRFLPPDELRKRYEDLGVSHGEAVVYCGSGVNACHDIIAIELAGLGPARLYAGSYSEWSRTPDKPIET